MEFQSDDKRYGLKLDSNNIARMISLCSAAIPNETGGIIVGFYSFSHDYGIVTGISSPPTDSRNGRIWFQRGLSGLQSWLERLWGTKRHYYIGEWHFHPFAEPNPSKTDINQLEQISSSKSYRCPEPVLIIIGGDPSKINLCAINVYVFIKDYNSLIALHSVKQ
jgi:integrative and conjugative element protein (TIGR02256 family)